jgi:hypothetical protein
MKLRRLDYGQVLESSLNLLKKNIILFLPNLIMLFISFLLIMTFFFGSGLSETLLTKPYLLEDKAAMMAEFNQLSVRGPFIITLVLWLAGELLLGAFFAVMKFGMIRDVIKTGKTSLRSGAAFAEKNYLNYWFVHLFSMFIIFGPLLILLFIYFLFIKNATTVFSAGSFIMGLFAIVWLIYAALMAVRLFFVFPVMTFEREKYFKSVKHEFHYVKTHLGHTFVSFLIALGFIIGYNVVEETVNFFGRTMHGKTVLLIIAVIMFLFEIFVSTWEHIFIFKSYLAGKHIKDLVKKAGKSASQKKKSDLVKKSRKR